MTSWDFEGSDWYWPDPRDSRYWSCVSEALKERCAAVTAHTGAFFDTAFLLCDDFDNKNMSASFDLSAFDSILKVVVPYYLVTPEDDLLGEMTTWLSENYDLVGSVAYHKSTGNAVYVIHDETVWAVNTASTTSFDRGWRGHYTWESLCIDYKGISYEYMATPDIIDTRSDCVPARMWLMNRKKILSALKILDSGTETLSSLYEFDGTYDYASYYYQQHWNFDLAGDLSWCYLNSCTGPSSPACGSLPSEGECSTESQTNTPQTVNYATSFKNFIFLRKRIGSFMGTIYLNRTATCSGTVNFYGYEGWRATYRDKASNLAVNILVTGKARSLLNVFDVSNSVASSADQYEVEYDSDRTARSIVDTISEDMSDPSLPAKMCYNILGGCASYGSDNRGAQPTVLELMIADDADCPDGSSFAGWPSYPSAGLIAKTVDRWYGSAQATQEQINTDPVHYSKELVCLESDLTAENPLNFNFV